MRFSILTIVSLFLSLSANAQSHGFVENLGQWDEQIQAKYQLTNGQVAVVDNELRFALIEPELYHDAEHQAHDNPETDVIVNGHCYSMVFGSQLLKTDLYSKHKDYANYFLGNDRSKWKSRVGVFDMLYFRETEPGIDVHFKLENQHVKYTLQVAKRGDISDYQIEYRAVNRLEVREQQLFITLPNMQVIEQKPYAYQLIDNKEVEVSCAFVVEGKKVSFNVGDYNHDYMLFIDPVIVASTNSGSQVQTWGHSATYDQFGNIYGAGRPFGTGFPVDTGSFQMNFGGSSVDIGLCKMNEDGSQLLWSTYLGGSSDEYAHSLVVNGFNQIVVYGKVNSADYPVSINGFDTTYNGSTDIFITVLSDSGDALIGSTYVGGEGVDGANSLPVGSYNSFKGEVEVDQYSNIYVASTTTSDTFPVTPQCFQPFKDSLQDGVIFKMNFNASTMIASTYFGGSDGDGAFGVKIFDNGNVMVCGTTKSADLITTSSASQTVFQGVNDAYLTKFDQHLSNVLASTFIRTDSFSNDHGAFLQIDRDDAVYILGFADSISADSGKYQGPGNGSFIRKYSNTLDTFYWTSTFQKISHSAFLVDNCKNIYAGGNGANMNMELTPNAVQPSFAGFYILVLSPEADSLIHGTFYGATGSHVDGGTSRFDKRGAVYQATCTSGAFPLTATAFSGNQAGNFDLTLFKIDFEVESAVASAQAVEGILGCAPYSVSFTNYGSQGIDHYWYFSDNGDTALVPNPTHTFDSAGTFEVIYVVTDTVGCILSDTARLYITISDSNSIKLTIGDTICVNQVTMSVSTEYGSYSWSNGSAASSVTATTPGIYWVEITEACGVFIDTIDLNFTTPYQFQLAEDTAICELNFFIDGPLDADTYNWNTGETTQQIQPTSTGVYYLEASKDGCSSTDTILLTVSVPTFTQEDTLFCADTLFLSVSTNPGNILWNTGDTTEILGITQSGLYYVELSNGVCTTTDSILVQLGVDLPMFNYDSIICGPTIVSSVDPDADAYVWNTGDTNSFIEVVASGLYWVARTAGFCVDTDTISIELQSFNLNDSLPIICDQDSMIVFGFEQNDWSYQWSNGDTILNTTIYNSGKYWIEVNTGTCIFPDTLIVTTNYSLDFDLGVDFELCKGEEISFGLDTNLGKFFWSTGDTSRIIQVSDSGLLWLSVISNGCESRDSVNITWRSIDSNFSSLANVITPNQDGLNDKLEFSIVNDDLIKNYQLSVFNRWGVLVYQASNHKIEWDGRSFTGEDLPNGTYFLILDCETVCSENPVISIRDHVTLLR